MAALPQELLTQVDLIAQLKGVIASDLDFDKLTDDQKNALTTAAILAGYTTNLAIFLDLKLHPEKIGLPPLPPEELETAVMNAEILAANLKLYADQKVLKDQIDAQFKNRSQEERKLIERMVLLRVVQIQAELLAAQANADTSQTLAAISTEADPKNPPLPLINEASEAIILAAIAATDITYTKTQIDEAVNTLTTAAIAGIADLAEPQSLNETLQAALAASPHYSTPTAILFRQTADTVTLTPIPNYSEITATHAQITPVVAVNLTQILLPSQEIKPSQTQITLSQQAIDKAEKVQKEADQLATKVILNPRSDDVYAAVSGTITASQREQLVSILIADNLVTRIAPTREGATAARVIRELDKANPLPVPIELLSMGLTMRAVKEKIETDPKSKTAQFFHNPQNSNVLKQLEAGFQKLENIKDNDLGKEISGRLRLQAAQAGLPLPPGIRAPSRPGALSGIAAQYQGLTNRISGFLPGRAGQVFNFFAHPIQSFQGYLGNVIGNRIVGQFRNWIAQKVVSKIANETLKKGAELILKEGLTKGLASLATKLGVEATLGATGIGTPIAIAMLALDIISVVSKPIMNAINGVFRAFTGEDFDARTAAAIPLAAVSGIGSILGGLGVVTITAAASGALILLGSIFVGFILYISVIAVAPIIASIAQLESGIGPQQVAFGPILPPYTGPILAGCPKIWPLPTGTIIQGPHGSYSHQLIEAVDIAIPVGTPVKSITDGTVLEAGWATSHPSYGNWIRIESTLSSGQKYTIIYGHLAQVRVTAGNNVQAGSVIALSGDTSSVPSFANPHLHLEYIGTSYNSCPAGGVQIPEGCYGTYPVTPGTCTIDGKAITIL